MEFDASGIPYLRLPPPYSSVTLTTYRATDAPTLISMLNDPAIYMNLAGPPFPFLQEHHDSKVQRLETDTERALKEFKEFETRDGQRIWASAVPFTVIRELDRESGAEKVIGDLVLRRSDFLDINDEDERDAMKSRNDTLEPGDPEIVWEIGFSLVSSVHGRGIMTAVLDSLTKEWLVPHMNVQHMFGSYLEHNVASKRVFEKCGWKFVKFEPNRIELPENMTGSKGKKFGMGVMRWDRYETG